jgi:hypothetical protein
MKMTDLSFTWGDSDGCCAPAPTGKKKEPRKEYPTLYIRCKGELPDLPVGKDGVGMAKIKFKVLGYRTPTDGDKTIELEVHGIAGEGAAEIQDTEEEDTEEEDGGIEAALDKVAKEAPEGEDYEGDK